MKQGFIGIYWCFCLLLTGCSKDLASNKRIQIEKNSRIVLVGNNLCSRMQEYGHFETELQLRFPDQQLYIRNLCDGGNTAGFRPHSGRNSPWAFPGAEKFQGKLMQQPRGKGQFESPDQWLSRHQADIILAFFGYNESFAGADGLENFKEELRAFIQHSLQQLYNGRSQPQLAIISPIAFQDLSDRFDLPDGRQENKNLALYTTAMREIAAAEGVLFVDLFHLSKNWFEQGEALTIDGFQLNDKGYRLLAPFLVDHLFGQGSDGSSPHRELVRTAILDKNWYWLNDYKIPNGVHVFGRRFQPFGPDNYPYEIQKIRQLTAIRDTVIWAAIQGKWLLASERDALTSPLPEVQTNFGNDNKGNGKDRYLYGQEAIDQLQLAKGFKAQLFASEEEFKDLANPVQLSFDNKGRLWVACMPSYPHYRPGDRKPDDKLIILEDQNGDGRADKQTVFAKGLHLPLGFELAPEGVYLSQGTNFVLLQDTDGDDRADRKEILLSGFDDHDTHHAHSAYCADPSGAIYMAEGLFLHSNIETAYGPVRTTDGGFFRYNPKRRQLERTAQLAIPNPWSIAFDEWGQYFFTETSGPDVRWMMPGSVLPLYGVYSHKSHNLIEKKHQVRPTSGMEFISSRHFPEEMQGDMLINNTIGFLGIKQHRVEDEEAGYRVRHRQDLLWSKDPNFRPVDLEFAPDGSLYVVDWHNVLIGHMQHNARDPLRDHVHGRIYRITYPQRPLLPPIRIEGASIEELLDHLTLPEYRSRYRVRRALRGFEAEEVLPKLQSWIGQLDTTEARYEHHLLEGLWVSWGLNQVDAPLLQKLLSAKDFRVRAAAVQVLRYMHHQLKDPMALFRRGATDPHGRVRLATIVAASWLAPANGQEILDLAGSRPLDRWMQPAFETARAHLQGISVENKKQEVLLTRLKGKDKEQFMLGKEIYEREGYCSSCHQVDGGGLDASQYPPLEGTPWVTGSEERLIKLTLKGLMGPIKVLDKSYPGQVPMTPFGGLLNDEEVAAVLTYVRNAFGNQASVVTAETVSRVRKGIQDKEGFYQPEELLAIHPMQ